MKSIFFRQFIPLNKALNLDELKACLNYHLAILDGDKFDDLITILKDCVNESAFFSGGIEIIALDMIYEKYGVEEEDFLDCTKDAGNGKIIQNNLRNFKIYHSDD